MPRPFRFGTGVFATPSAQQFADSARRIESLGYDVFVVPDHFHSEGLAPVPALLAAANATTDLRVGSTVFDNDFRHPALLAKEAATLDLLSDGRLEFGLGAGWKKREYDQVGLTWDEARVRVSRLGEAIQLIKRLWSGAPVTYHGEHYRVTDLVNYPRPVQKPHPPVFIGGGGERLLSMAAREADIVGVIARALPGGGLDVAADSHALLRRKVEWVRAAAGDRLAEIELQSLVWKVAVTDHPDSRADQVARAYGLPIEHVLNSPYFLIGSVDTIVEQLLEQSDTYGLSYFVVYPEDFEAFAPVVAKLRGM